MSACASAGTFYIDEGKPSPGATGERPSSKSSDVVADQVFQCAARGYAAILPFFRADEQLRRNFFSRLKVLWYAGAAIAQHVYDEMQELALKIHLGERVLFSPPGLELTWRPRPSRSAGCWRCPHGADADGPVLRAALFSKLVPTDGKFESRVQGPTHHALGYWRQDPTPTKAFDEEGFYKIGDALKFEDENNPLQGLLFDGRIAEDFKLGTGTWVSVGPLRAKFISLILHPTSATW